MKKILITTILWLVLLIGSFFFGKDVGERVCEAKYLEQGINNQNSMNHKDKETSVINDKEEDFEISRKLGVVLDEKVYSVNL